jgi:hypothetical protein
MTRSLTHWQDVGWAATSNRFRHGQKFDPVIGGEPVYYYSVVDRLERYHMAKTCLDSTHPSVTSTCTLLGPI